MTNCILKAKRNRALLLILGLTLLAAFSAGGISCGSSSGPAATNQVQMSGLAFNPGTITVSAGTTVTWTNKEGTTHDIVSNDNLFASNSMSRNDTFQFTFTQTGTFQYHCSFHPSMTGKVIVN